MIDESRRHIYDYLYGLFFNVVTKNVYERYEPLELTKSDLEEGFIVTRVGDIYDASEFSGETYGLVRCYVEAFVPPVSRGRVDIEKYAQFEDAIDTVINEESVRNDDPEMVYHIQEGSYLSADTDTAIIADNLFHTFIKSFIVDIDVVQE